MARKSNFIGTTETGNLSALGNAQQRDYNFVKSLLDRDDLIQYFAEPSVQENQEKIDWYSDKRGQIIGFQDFSTLQVERARTELNWLVNELRSLASKAENQVDKQAIENLSVLPDVSSIKMVDEQIIIINWAYRLHKRAKGDRQSANFAGFVENAPDPEPVSEVAFDAGFEEVNVAKVDVVEKADVFEEESHSPTASFDDGSLESDQLNEPNIKTGQPLLFDKTNLVLLTVFFLLLILVLILLKDACGVRGLPFLYFC